MEVYASTIIERPVDVVWQVMRDFVALTAWSNVVTGARIDNGRAVDQPGAIRRLTLDNGAVFVETLVALSDQARELSYDIVEGPLPVVDYLATMRAQPITAADWTFASWSARFDTSPDSRAEMQDVVGGQICAGGLASLKAYLENR